MIIEYMDLDDHSCGISRRAQIMNITVLVLVLTVVCGTLSVKQSAIPFYSSSGGSYLFMSNFSKERSFASPWPVIGPDAIAVACGIIAFFLCFGALEAMSRLKKILEGESGCVKSAQLNGAHHMPTVELKEGM
uniref:Col_cuticle_N domain-containing protein n=1 Tax=Ascaris lumbricoides TaxID=6252 RepID=A0A0M3HSV0_ASCLU